MNALASMVAAARLGDATEWVDYGPNRLILFEPPDPATRPSYAVIAGRALRSPSELTEGGGELFQQARESGLVWHLGPPTDLNEQLNLLTLVPDAQTHNVGRRSVYIIDVGFAFWNPRFWDASGDCRFKAISFLRFCNNREGDSCPQERITKGDFTTLMGNAGPDLQAGMIRDLAKKYPDSFWGLHPEPDGFWHGTAIADIIAADENVDLYGIELPHTALTDWSGDTLEQFLCWIFHAFVLNIDGPADIVLAFGFPGGPHGNLRPGPRWLRKVMGDLNDARHPDPKLRLHLPTGNHRQDRCHAVIEPDHSLTWRIAPDDASHNTLEMATGLQCLEVALTAPNGSSAVTSLNAGAFAWIIERPDKDDSTETNDHSEGWIIGAIYHSDQLPCRVRIVLAPTQRRAGDLPTPLAGDWVLTVKGSEGGALSNPVPVPVWILRDDGDPRIEPGFARRPSHLHDPSYRESDGDGAPLLTDDLGTTVRRAGTVSVLTTMTDPDKIGITIVGASEIGPDGEADWPWSGLSAAGDSPTASPVIADAQGNGVPCLGNGGPRRFRMLGTSAAVALHVRGLAAVER